MLSHDIKLVNSCALMIKFIQNIVKLYKKRNDNKCDVQSHKIENIMKMCKYVSCSLNFIGILILHEKEFCIRSKCMYENVINSPNPKP